MTTPGAHDMETASGAYVNVVEPDAATIRLGDIAFHLSRLNRYTGATRRPISVAEHTILVAERLATQGHDAPTVLRGLHHDDAEAYLGDVGRPLKLALGRTYRGLEVRMMDTIVEALDLPRRFDTEAVDAADEWALAAEAWHLMPSRGKGWTCDGLFDPVDPDYRNPYAASLLASSRADGLSARNVREEWVRHHREWADLAVDHTVGPWEARTPQYPPEERTTR